MMRWVSVYQDIIQKKYYLILNIKLIKIDINFIHLHEAYK